MARSNKAKKNEIEEPLEKKGCKKGTGWFKSL